MRLLGIDYGEKRIGLATSDELGVATPLTAAIESTEEERVATILCHLVQRRIEAIVIGYPYNMDGSVGFKAKEVDAFIERLAQKTPLPIHRMDERLTTHTAQQGAVAMGRKGKRDRRVRASGQIDSAAAAIILQDFVEAQGIGAPPPFWESEDLAEEAD